MSIREGKESRAGPIPRGPAPCPLGRVLALWQILPIRPALLTYKYYGVNNLRGGGHIHAVEVVGSNPAAPTIKSMHYERSLRLQRSKRDEAPPSAPRCRGFAPLRRRLGSNRWCSGGRRSPAFFTRTDYFRLLFMD